MDWRTHFQQFGKREAGTIIQMLCSSASSWKNAQWAHWWIPPPSANCEESESNLPQLLAKLTDHEKLKKGKKNSDDATTPFQSTSSQSNETNVIDVEKNSVLLSDLEKNTLAYMAGYVGKKVLEKHSNCQLCREMLLQSKEQYNYDAKHALILFKDNGRKEEPEYFAIPTQNWLDAVLQQIWKFFQICCISIMSREPFSITSQVHFQFPGLRAVR